VNKIDAKRKGKAYADFFSELFGRSPDIKDEPRLFNFFRKLRGRCAKIYLIAIDVELHAIAASATLFISMRKGWGILATPKGKSLGRYNRFVGCIGPNEVTVNIRKPVYNVFWFIIIRRICPSTHVLTIFPATLQAQGWGLSIGYK
jgi:hypothetical protein